jgi:uncharacterized Zn-finger protein
MKPWQSRRCERPVHYVQICDFPCATARGKIIVQAHRIACDGGGGAMGHPKVWYEMGSDHEVECLYCGRVFVQDLVASDSGH